MMRVIDKLSNVFYYVIDVLLICLALMILNFDFMPLRISYLKDRSMSPTLNEGSFYIGYNLVSDYSRGDVVVVNSKGGHVIRRIIGCPHDKIEVIDGITYVNGVEDEYCKVDLLNRSKGINLLITLDDNEYFVLGDDRKNSYDCRHTKNHYVDGNDIKSKVVFVN